jgi:hypothetical protein
MGKQLYLNATLFRMSLSDNNMCSVCPLHRVEDLQHFVLECPLYEDVRADIFSQIEYVFSSNKHQNHTFLSYILHL